MVDISRMLFATDLSPDALLALELVKATARRLAAEVIVLHVDEAKEAAPFSTASASRREQVRRALTRTCEELAREGVLASRVLRTGDPAREILRVASDRAVGMVVIATHGWTRAQNLLLGSVADRVVRHATMPVLTVRHPDRWVTAP